MYPAYKVSDVLEMPSITFFTMLSEGYRQQAAEQIRAATIASVPYMDEDSRSDYIRQLKWASDDPELMGSDDDYSGVEQIAELFEKMDE